MRNNSSFVRKVVYVCIMALLMVPLSYLSAPSTRAANGETNAGGLLAQIRNEYGLAQSDLGEIDPTSESMKLATLGMRGVAANVLWTKANHYKKTEDWDNLRATLNQITKLQPNFVSVWIFQGWNLAFNVSVEFDDYRSRYHWVKKGVDFLIEGTQYNRDNPRLLKELGWSFQQKIGRSDEKAQFRELFRNDEDFHGELQDYVSMDDSLGPDNKPDNWLVAGQWYRKAQNAVDRLDAVLKGESPLVFNSHAPMTDIRYSEAIEQDGYLDEKAQIAWEKARQAWYAFGDRDIPHTRGFQIRLNNGERAKEAMAEARQQLDQLLPGLREQIFNERFGKLSAEEKSVYERYNSDSGNLSEAEYRMKDEIDRKLEITHAEVADRAPPEKLGDARRALVKLLEAENMEQAIRHYRQTVNFEYWRRRCEAEKTDNAINARRYLFEAERAFTDADLEKAKQAYEKSWDEWAAVFEQFPALMDDITASDLLDSIVRYRDLLKQVDEPFPPPGFKLQRLIDLHQSEFEQLTAEYAPAERQPEAAPQGTSTDEPQ
ncbi:MAG: hypothetical protein U0795_18500 [Pirellulales bacterium]